MRETSYCLFFDNNQADVTEAFNSTSRYLDYLFNIDNPYLERMVSQIYPTIHKICKVFSTFYHRHPELIVKYSIGLKRYCNREY